KTGKTPDPEFQMPLLYRLALRKCQIPSPRFSSHRELEHYGLREQALPSFWHASEDWYKPHQKGRCLMPLLFLPPDALQRHSMEYPTFPAVFSLYSSPSHHDESNINA